MENDLKVTFDQWYEKQWSEQNTAPSADEAWDYQQQRIDELTLERGTLQLEVGNLHNKIQQLTCNHDWQSAFDDGTLVCSICGLWR